ncbi:hypothetical protein ES703_117385 [subsurface metagenome]
MSEPVQLFEQAAQLTSQRRLVRLQAMLHAGKQAMELVGLGENLVFLPKFLLFLGREFRLFKLLDLKLVKLVELPFIFHLGCEPLPLRIQLNEAAVGMGQHLTIRQKARVGIQEIDVRADT